MTNTHQACSEHPPLSQPCGLTTLLASWPASEVGPAEEQGKLFFPEQTQMLQIALNGCPAPTTPWCHTSLTATFLLSVLIDLLQESW